ncbi:MAG: glycosyltransferase [Sulfuricellaceae bacterium]|nr:glycosyltransferase [Sulfuricellaceae bacterium]
MGAYTKSLALALTECEGVNVSVLTDVRAVDAAARSGVNILTIVRSWAITDMFRIAKYIKRSNPDIIHIQYPTQGYSGRLPGFLPLLIWLLGKPCVQTWHEPVFGRISKLMVVGLRLLITVREEFMADNPVPTKMALKHTKIIWIPAASILPTVILSNEDRAKFRQQYASKSDTLLSYYGFVAPLKGIEILLEIVVKTNARLLMACDFMPGNDYHQSLLDKIKSLGISSRITIMGFLPEDQLASTLAVSDAVVLPFRDGAARWNTSIDGALAQGVFVVTTSVTTSGYNKDKNIYFARPGDTDEMIAAIQKYAGYRIACKQSTLEWKSIAERHLNVYRQLITR